MLNYSSLFLYNCTFA